MEEPLAQVLASGGTAISQTGQAQPALFILEYALARMWQRSATMCGGS